ncbi:MAG: hypothetical protein IIB56_04725 [Planctomycetes bacterium]|nr:hypothetical protein [Planctomycetota bacterium]
MNKTAKIAIITALVVVVGVVIILRQKKPSSLPDFHCQLDGTPPFCIFIVDISSRAGV